MISVDEARGIIDDNLMEFKTHQVNLLEASRCFLAEDIHADRDFPPFDRVTMDGIAINSSTLNGGRDEFIIEHLQAAGDERSTLSDINCAIEVMTGAILPANTDAVIRYEDLEITEEEGNKKAVTLINSIKPFKNVHRQGEDRKIGDRLIPAKTLISSPELAVLATTGKSSVEVIYLPKAAIISTGDELVDVDQTPEEHQIRKSNIYAILNEFKKLGIEADLFHIVDDQQVLEDKLVEILKEYPLLILSGGVSKGKLDFVPAMLEKVGIRKHFHRVLQRPGKPLWFGSSENNVVFALPGNPVSTYMCFMIYVRSWILKCLDLTSSLQNATLDTDVSFTPNLTYFMQVKVYLDKNSRLMAKPVKGHGSGDLANLLDVDGFLELPIGQTLYNRGNLFPLHLFRGNDGISKLDS